MKTLQTEKSVGYTLKSSFRNLLQRLLVHVIPPALMLLLTAWAMAFLVQNVAGR